MRARSTVPLAALLLLGCGARGRGEDPTGSWDLDKPALADVLVREMAKADPAAAAGRIRERALAAADSMQMRLELRADGTMTSHSSMGGRTAEGTGSWRRQGDQLVMVTTTEGQAETQTGRLLGGTIVVTLRREGITLDLPFRRR